MRGKPFLFISIACLVILAACAPAIVPPTGSAGSSSGASGSEPMATPAANGTPSPSVGASNGEVTSVPQVSTTMPGGPVVSVGTSEGGTAVALPTEGASGSGGGGAGAGGILTPGPDGNLSVTLQDQGKTVRLKVGERFLLNLGEGYEWSPVVADQSVFSRVPNIMVIRGAQGIYEAHKAGTTTLNVTGDPTCRQSKPPCGIASRMFSVTIEVQ